MNVTTWEEVKSLTDRLCRLILENECSLNLIVAVARGGFVPARLLSSGISVQRMASIGVAYVDADRTRREFYSVPTPIDGSYRVLLVEDALETGRSLQDARDYLRRCGTQVWTAAYFYMPHSVVQPDFSLGVVDTIPAFPWE